MTRYCYFFVFVFIPDKHCCITFDQNTAWHHHLITCKSYCLCWNSGVSHLLTNRSHLHRVKSARNIFVRTVWSEDSFYTRVTGCSFPQVRVLQCPLALCLGFLVLNFNYSDFCSLGRFFSFQFGDLYIYFVLFMFAYCKTHFSGTFLNYIYPFKSRLLWAFM